MPKGKKNIKRKVKDRLKFENRTSPGSVRHAGRSRMEVADQMSTGRLRRNQSTDANN